jgi:hypothetical protein
MRAMHPSAAMLQCFIDEPTHQNTSSTKGFSFDNIRASKQTKKVIGQMTR